ncbi:choice-of-anchor E domain-containing protein [Limnothrix sp. FACHB-881]|uniref:choice-of-anchor E domain-containing protein n=1 Tax=Limnothrix sp. FACHB-881 TaxID=2692819 RepID=UPI00199419A6|nr:choice-of-anchor E domain-containing protein [Limnothrix sp. FACHB-881]MBD2635780.1 choice-of-anchor E domain-containing protein [Limnothrix sp. FACHB-881]
MKSWFAPSVALATISLSSIAAPALALSISYSDAYVPDASTVTTLNAIDAFTGGLTDAEARNGLYGFTDIEEVLSIQKFDPSLGTLKSAKLTFDTGLWQKAYYEHLGRLRPGNAAAIKFDFEANLNLTSSGGTSVFDIPLTGAHDFTASSFDGTQDFAGTSGRKFATSLNGQYQQTKTITDAAALAGFIGAGSIDYTFSASALFSVFGPGNLSAGVLTLAKGALRVDYEYEKESTSVPEPTALLGLGLVAGGAMVQRRLRAAAPRN